MSNYYYGASDLTSGYYVSHHGILGQKWGVRRFQNEDGTLTAAGKKRYSKSESSILSANVKSKTQADLYKKVAKTKLYKDIDKMESDNTLKLKDDVTNIFSKALRVNQNANKEAAEAVRKLGGNYRYVYSFKDIIMDKRITDEEAKAGADLYMKTGAEAAIRLNKEIGEEYAKLDLKNRFHNIEKEIRDYTKRSLSESTINSEIKADDALLYSKDSGISKQKLDGALYNAYHAKNNLGTYEEVIYNLDEKYNKRR